MSCGGLILGDLLLPVRLVPLSPEAARRGSHRFFPPSALGRTGAGFSLLGDHGYFRNSSVFFLGVFLFVSCNMFKWLARLDNWISKHNQVTEAPMIFNMYLCPAPDPSRWRGRSYIRITCTLRRRRWWIWDDIFSVKQQVNMSHSLSSGMSVFVKKDSKK